MTVNAITSLGTTYEISAGPPATYDEVGFAALSYTSVGSVTDAGSFGAQFETVSEVVLAERLNIKRKGSLNYGTIDVMTLRDEDDAGQALAQSGVDGVNIDVVYSHKVTLQDGEIHYFTGQLYSSNIEVGAADNMIKTGFTVEIDNKVISVAAP